MGTQKKHSTLGVRFQFFGGILNYCILNGKDVIKYIFKRLALLRCATALLFATGRDPFCGGSYPLFAGRGRFCRTEGAAAAKSLFSEALRLWIVKLFSIR